MSVLIEKNDENMIAYLMGDIDHHNAKGIREKIDLDAESFSPSLLILDFKDVTFMDSSGIGLVMGRYKLMKSLNGTLKITNASSHIKKVMRLAGLDKLSAI